MSDECGGGGLITHYSSLITDGLDLIIHYNVECGYEEEALALARRLFAHFDQAIDSLSLIPVPEPEFDLYLGGCLVHARSQSGRAPRLADVLAALEGGA